MWEKSERIGKMLVNMGLVDEDQVKESLKLSSDNGKTLGQNMYELGYVTDSSLLQLLVAQGAATPWFLSQDPPEQRILRLLSTSVMREHMLIPIIRTGDLLLLAIADAKDHNALERVRTLTGLRVECVEAQPERIKEVIETVMNAERGTAEPEKASKEKADSKKKGKKQEEPAPEEAAAEQTPEAPPQTEQPDPAQTTPVFTQSELAAERPHPHKHGKPQSDEAQLAQPRITVESEVVSQDDTAPVAGLVDQIIADSVRRGATEILVESTSEGLSIRYRIEGQLRSIGDVPKSLAALVDARFRLLASMDIHDVDTAQVGKAEYKTANRTVKFDVCVVPTSSGSRFMFRSLPERIEPTLLEELGLAKNELGLVRESLDHPEGLLLVAGPTIEDRTATLYSLLMDLASPARDIVTCEENIYGSVSGVSHSNVKVRHSRSRSDYLNLLLKHAPDVLMVDNVSDDATAHSAVRTALAGRFVAAGIEAKGALNTIARL
ncbi:MAG TPA: ATPase, T2SS/T4P/T4SS family, partial [Fimbriimonadaceae bacterium]|nr:ATPase, T2SS/T4P/T4SS family [Fimbriimonadaceae bacterium]